MYLTHTLVSKNEQGPYSFELTAVLYTVYGSALLSHCLIGAGFSDTVKVGAGFDLENGKQHCAICCLYTVCQSRLAQRLQLCVSFTFIFRWS